MIKYFLKIHSVKREKCILNTILNEQFNNINVNNYRTNWASQVRLILQSSGLHEIWIFPNSVRIETFIPKLRTRLRDIYISNWRSGLADSTSLDVYREIKLNFEKSAYISQLDNPKYRNILAKLHLSSHKLNIEIGRHNNVPRQDRKCTLCNLNDIEDEFHVVLKCPIYIHIRKEYV